MNKRGKPLSGTSMSKLEVKHPDLNAAMAKAGGPSPTALLQEKLQQRRKRKKPKPEYECPKEALCLKEREQVEANLKDARRSRDMLGKKLEEARGDLSAAKTQLERDQRRIKEDEEIHSALRKVIGAGKAAKASALPGRIASLLAGIEEAGTALASIRNALGNDEFTTPSALSEGITRLTERLKQLQIEAKVKDVRESHLREELEGLRKESQIRLTELENFQDLADTTILVGGSSHTGDKLAIFGADAQPSEGEGSWSQAEEIVPTFFTRFVSSNSLEAVKSRYASWVLGLGPYSRSRTGRTQLGVSQAWTNCDLLAEPPINLEGTSGTQVTIRDTEEGWLLRFIHTDTRYEGTSWLNLARLSSDPEGVKIEHALIRMTGAMARRPGTAAAVPNVLKDLFKTASMPYPWEDFGGKVKQIRSNNVELFVQGILLNPQRDVPVVVVSRTLKSGAFAIPPGDLAQTLHGIAVVFETEEGSPFLLTQSLKASGIESRMLSCFDGSVRVYLPGFSAESDPYKHSLWVRGFIETKGVPEAIRIITRKVAAYSVGLRTPPGFARLIEEHDLKVVTENTSRLAASGHPSEHLEALQRKVQALQERLDQVRTEAQQVPTLRMRIEELEGRISYSFDLEQLVLQENASLKEERDDFARRVHNLRAQLTQAEEGLHTEERLNAATPEFLDGVLHGAWSDIGTHVRLLQARYPDRLVLLPKALSSADECTFDPPDKPKQMLYRLVTDYYQALANGSAGDVEGAKVFGKDGYASREGDNLTSAGVRARTFTYEGENVLMEAHLKITKGFERNSSNQVFRTHFHWDSRRRLIVVGHIGGHLVP